MTVEALQGLRTYARGQTATPQACPLPSPERSTVSAAQNYLAVIKVVGIGGGGGREAAAAAAPAEALVAMLLVLAAELPFWSLCTTIELAEGSQGDSTGEPAGVAVVVAAVVATLDA